MRGICLCNYLLQQCLQCDVCTASVQLLAWLCKVHTDVTGQQHQDDELIHRLSVPVQGPLLLASTEEQGLFQTEMVHHLVAAGQSCHQLCI